MSQSMSGGANSAIDINIDVIIDGEKMTIRTDQLINQGGEGAVFGVNTRKRGYIAAKVIHPVMRSGSRFQKLVAQIKRQPPMPHRTVAPDDLIYDAHSPKEILGLTMKYIDVSQYDQLIWWTKQEFRLSNQISFNDIVEVMYEVREEVDEAHIDGYFYGDFNPKGILVLKKKYWTEGNKNDRVRIVDADAAVFDNFHCEVFTLDYLDPRLWDKIKRKVLSYVEYDEGSDNWAFMAMFLQVLTTIAPWHGYHPIWQQNMKALIARGLTVLHQKDGVEYPPNAVPLSQLPKPFQDYFEDIMVNGKRYLIGEDVLANILGRTTNVVLSRPVTATPVAANVQVVKIFDDMGLILDFFISGDVIHVLCISNEGKYLYMTYYNGKLSMSEIKGVQLGMTYRILSPNLVSEVDQTPIQASSGPFRVYNLQYNSWRNEMSGTGLARYPIVGGGNGRMNIIAGGRLNSRDINNASDIKAGHTVGKNSDVRTDIVSGSLAGYNLNGVTYSWFFSRKGFTYDIPISPLRDAEFMTDWEVLWGDNSALLVRKTEYQGNVQTRLDEVDLTSSNVQKRVIGRPLTIDEQLFRPINGAAYVRDDQDGSLIFYATQEGIVQENLRTQKRDVFNKTKGVVNAGQALRLYQDGMLAIGDGKVIYVTL